ncbi:hypothetical protein CRV24_001294 [Beauveria bassiana]|nr:hypothetical protein CRV24_001294 [Beauveria bassiana]
MSSIVGFSFLLSCFPAFRRVSIVAIQRGVGRCNSPASHPSGLGLGGRGEQWAACLPAFTSLLDTVWDRFGRRSGQDFRPADRALTIQLATAEERQAGESGDEDGIA